ncbi:unnamed protein product [Symbiodinium sp. CCMP2592]|nr:unnamed protein product [Symbiodinium sp. CCMP2592]
MPHVFNYEKGEFEQIHFDKAVKCELLTSQTCSLTLCMRGAGEILSGVDLCGTPICIRHVLQHCAVAAEIRVRPEDVKKRQRVSESMKFLLAQEATQTKKEEAIGAGLLLSISTCSHRQARAKRKEAMKD